MACSTETSPVNLGLGKFIWRSLLPFVPSAVPAMDFLREKKGIRKNVIR
jgi:hypothetical protein